MWNVQLNCNKWRPALYWKSRLWDVKSKFFSGEGAHLTSNPSASAPLDSNVFRITPCIINLHSVVFLLCWFFFHGKWKFWTSTYKKFFSFWGTLSPRLPTGASPLDPTGGLPSPDPIGSDFIGPKRLEPPIFGPWGSCSIWAANIRPELSKLAWTTLVH